MNKKIIISTNTSWYAWNMRSKLGHLLQSEGYEVIFVCPYDKYSENLKKDFKYFDIGIDTKSVNPLKDLIALYKYYKIYKSINPDIVLQYTIKPNIYGTIAASMLRIPTINNIAGLGSLFIKKNILTKIASLLYKVSQKMATKVFFQNSDDFSIFVEKKLVNKDQCDILPGSGVDIKKFTPLDKENNKTFVFLLVSRMLWAKGINEFVEASKIVRQKYKNVEFQLLGHVDTPGSSSIPIEKLDLWHNEEIITYLGSSDDVRVEIREADCIVLPSYYREGTPRILLESASMEKPIITTDNVGCRDVVDDGSNGFICKIKDIDDLAEKMEKMIKLSREERLCMGKKGREKVIKEFDEEIVLNKYKYAINKILNNNTRK